MGDDRQPGYDYFVPPRSVAAPPTGAPGEPYPGPAGGPYSPVPPGTVIPAQMHFADQLQPARKSSMVPWLIIPLVVVGLLVATGILAAIAIPVFLSQREKAQYQGTTVSLPATFNNLKRNDGADAVKVARSFMVDGVVRESDVAVYGKVGPTMVVIMAMKPPGALSSLEQKQLREDVERTFAAQDTPLLLLGGPTAGDSQVWQGCGHTDQGLEVCIATSPGSLVSVMTRAGEADPLILIRQAHAATVHRP